VLRVGGQLRFIIGNASGTWKVVTGGTVLQTNRWYHVAGLYDGTYLKVYVDGVLDGTATVGSVTISYTPRPNTGPVPSVLYLGIMHNDYVSGPAYTAHLFSPFNGIIDEVKLYNRALTLGEIQKDYQRTSVVAYDAESSTASLRTRIQSAALWRNYYPFGQTMAGRSYTSITDPRYKYTEKERDVETGYDYFGARYYDSRIGRWMSVDPLAGKYPQWSTYVYGADCPVYVTDPNGIEWRVSVDM